MIQMGIDTRDGKVLCVPEELAQPTATEAISAFGSIMFSFGGASIFPTIMMDMKDQSKFKYSIVLSMMSKT